MEGILVNFRRSRHQTSPNHAIVKISSVDNRKKAMKLVGKKVVWTSPSKKQITGVIKSAHGNKGALRAIFEKGLPGQALGTKVKID